ncbi:hypothetical protein CRUP_010924, partial [Coryphaenoides rupestris]
MGLYTKKRPLEGTIRKNAFSEKLPTYAMEGDISVESHTEGLTCLPHECKASEEGTNGHSNHKPVTNGLPLIGHHGVKEHTNGKASLRSLPISALKQNGLLQSLAAGGGGGEPMAADESSELEKAREEWEAVESLQPAATEESAPTPLISFNEALQYFQTTDLGELLRSIQPTVRRTGLAAITHFFFGPPRLHRELLEERDLVFAIAQCSLDNSQAVHMRVLQTIYKRLNFPFSVMSINMTRIALQVLREEALSKECNRRQQVVGVLNEFYVATYLHLYQLWKSQQKTISDSGYVLKEVELLAKKSPRQMLRRLEVFLRERRSGAVPRGPSPDPKGASPDPQGSPSLGGARAGAGQGSKEKQMHFTGVCELPPDMEGE